MSYLKGHDLWIVYKQWPTGKVERHSAYFSEELARENASRLVGQDGALIGLESIPVIGEPECIHDWQGYQSPKGGFDATCRKCGEQRHTD